MSFVVVFNVIGFTTRSADLILVVIAAVIVVIVLIAMTLGVWKISKAETA